MFKSLFKSESLNDFDKELLSSNLLGAKNLDELHELEKISLQIKYSS